MTNNLFKSIGVIALGVFITVLFSHSTDFILEYLGIFPTIGQSEFDTWMYFIALIYRTFFSAVAGYLVASLAPDRPMRLVIILGIVGTIAAILGVVAAVSTGLIVWYPVMIAVLAFPSVWAGGKVRVMHQSAGLQSKTEIT